ncbi:AraC family transcriptional regulator [Amycolatopsis thermoflava]|uniref:AraC family transcriptional regulator n=1 Tax=Amycolatopsis thermoflava TaxID=84480 RepID=UPI00380B5F88
MTAAQDSPWRQEVPLSLFELYRSDNLEYVREQAGRIFTPHRLRAVGRAARLDAVMCSRRMRDISFTYASYGAEVQIACGELRDYYVVQIPLSGGMVVQHGRRQAWSGRETASVLSPFDPLRMRWSADCAQLVCRIERPALESRLSEMMGRSLTAPLSFDTAMNVADRPGRAWRLWLENIVAELSHPNSFVDDPMVLPSVEQTLMAGLLVSQPHNYSSALRRQQRSVSSRVVRLVVDRMEADPGFPHTTASLAKAVGVTDRSLQLAFRKELNLRPMEYLRQVRLRRVHNELLAAEAETVSVTEVARKWGFSHVGHFAARYREHFGENPSDTLRRG